MLVNTTKRRMRVVLSRPQATGFHVQVGIFEADIFRGKAEDDSSADPGSVSAQDPSQSSRGPLSQSIYANHEVGKHAPRLHSPIPQCDLGLLSRLKKLPQLLVEE